MAGETEQLTGVIPVVVTGGIVMGFAKGMQDMYSQPRRRKGNGKARKSSGSPWSGNPMGNGHSKSPW